MESSKKKIKTGVKIFIMIFFVLVICVGSYVTYKVLNKEEKPAQNTENNISVEKEEQNKKMETEASLIMVGDALIHGAVYYDAKINAKYNGYDFKPMLENIKPIIMEYDLAYYNQETILGGTSLGLSHYPRFNSPYEVGDAFIDAGFNLVSLATNHTMDRGEQAVINSNNYWKKHEDTVMTAGSYNSYNEKEMIQIREVNGISYAFFSYTMWTNGLSSPHGKDYLWDLYSYEKAKHDIEKVRDQVDVVMVAMHWGVEYSNGISDIQRQTASDLSNLGVDIIIGAHPHVVEPIEMINNTLVIYSLGNFISAQETVNKLTGLMVSVTIKKVVENGISTISLENIKAELIYTYFNKNSSTGFKVYPYRQLNDKLLPGYRNYYEQFMDIVVGNNNQITPIGLE